LTETHEFRLDPRTESVTQPMPYGRRKERELASKFLGKEGNEFTRHYGEVGREAIRRFLGEARERGYIDRETSIEFVE